MSSAELRIGSLTADFGRTAADYGRSVRDFRRVSSIACGRRGWRGPGCARSTLGTGTGTIARGLARLGCDCVGLDRSRPLMEEAGRLDREAGVTVRYVEAPAEDTGFPKESFDLVTAGQCRPWFDRGRAAAEAHRVLAAGGHLVIGHFDWIPLHGNVADVTERFIEKHNPAWQLGGGVGMYPQWLKGMAIAGFRDPETFSFDVDVPYSREGWRGRIRASARIGASLSSEAIAAF
jgi:SAM-dependent methyltransferase